MSLIDRINPVALKELRQMVRSRIMNVSIIAFLVFQVFVSLVIAVSESSMRSRHVYSRLYHGTPAGQTIFIASLVILLVVILAVVPGMTFSRVMREKKPGASDLQYTTMLSPADFVNGKLLCSLILSTMFVFAALPVMSLAYLMRGVSVTSIAVLLLLGVGASVIVNLGVLIAGASDFTPSLRWIIGFCFGVVGMAWSFGGTIFTLAMQGARIYSWMDGGDIATLAVCLVIACMLMWSLAVSAFSSPAGNRFRSFKIAFLISFVVSLVHVLVLSGIAGNSDEKFMVWGCLVLAASSIFAFIMSGCRALVPRRVCREVRESRVPAFLHYFTTTGAENGIVLAFLVALVASAAVIVFGIITPRSSWDFDRNIRDASIIFAFIFYYFGMLMVLRGIWLKISRRFSVSPVFIPVALAFILIVAFVTEMSLSHSYGDTAFIPFDALGILALNSSDKNDVFVPHLILSSITFVVGIVLVGKDWLVYRRTDAR